MIKLNYFFWWSVNNWFRFKNQTLDLARIKIIIAALFNATYYPIIKDTIASNLSASISGSSVHLSTRYPSAISTPTWIRTLHAFARNPSSHPIIPFLSPPALQERSKDGTKNSLPPNLFPARLVRVILARSFHRFSHPAGSRSVGELVRKRHNRPKFSIISTVS